MRDVECPGCGETMTADQIDWQFYDSKTVHGAWHEECAELAKAGEF